MITQLIGRAAPGQTPSAPAVSAASSLDPVFSGLARLAAIACAAPLASISVNDCGQAWCTSDAAPPSTVPRHDPFSFYTVQAAGLFEVSDTALDERFRESEPGGAMPAVRSYAGCALRTAGGDLLGTLAVYDTHARSLSPEQRTALLLLAEQAAAQAELRSRLTEVALLSGVRPAAPSVYPEIPARALLESAPVAIYHTDAAGEVLYSNSEYRRIFGLQPGHSGDAWAQSVHPD